MTVNLEKLSVKQLYKSIADLTHERDELQRNAHELAIEGNHMRTAIEFATAPDMWVEQHDGMLDYRYAEWYVDVLNAALEAPSTDITIAEIVNKARAEGVELAIKTLEESRFGDAGDLALLSKLLVKLRKGSGR